MKIDTTRLTPLFDQYSNQENRLTHALMHTLAASDRILSGFMKEVLGIKSNLKGRDIEITTQKRPFSIEDMDSEKNDSVPDGWIIDNRDGIGVLIEVKDIKNSVRLGQLRAHLKKLANFEESYLVVITPDLVQPHEIDLLLGEHTTPSKTIWKSWNEIYTYFRGSLNSVYQKMSKEQFVLDAMLEYLEQRREVLGFQGIRFRKGFDIEEAKKILMSEMAELQDTVREMYPMLSGRRGVITTAFSQSTVWDCFGVPEGFTNDIHITVALDETYQDISLTVPHKASHRWKRLKTIFENAQEEKALFEIIKKLRLAVPDLFLEYIQRHFLYQRKGYRDAYLEFHIDTCGTPFRNGKSKIKEFPIWYKAIKEAITTKRQINAQVMFKARYYLNDTPNIDNERFLLAARKTLNDLKPLYSFLMR